MSEDLPVYILGFVTGIIVLGLLQIQIPISDYNSYQNELKKIEQCEKSLPRDQKCVLIAVPEEKK